MKSKLLVGLTVVFASTGYWCFAAGISLETAPPVVVRTQPVAGSTNVDPRTSEIVVQFSKPMQDGSWSWSTWGQENFPDVTGDIHYESDGRTCVLPVKLEPVKFYATWLNSERFGNFKDRAGRSAVPYLLTFTTAGQASDTELTTKRVSEHTVKAGDTLSAIAREYREEGITVTMDEIMKANPGLNPARLYVGQKILVPVKVFAESEVREVARQFAQAIKERDDQRLRSLSTDIVVEGWVNAVNHFGDELRVKLTEAGVGFEPLERIQDILLKGDLAAVKTAHLKDKGMYLALFFYRTKEGWRNCCLQNSPSTKSLEQNFEEFAAREDALEKMEATTSGKPVPDELLALLLNDDQKAVVAWTDRQFRSYWDERTFDGWPAEEIESLEKRMIDALNGPRSRDYYTAINTLGALRSTNALPRLRELAFERVDKNNRDRWMAVRVLGLMGDRESVPDLIHLVYHGNQNTHWWAQISLVRLTGQNFGGDWDAWGKWWNESGGQPPYNPEIIRWWDGQAEDDKLAESLAESNQKFLESIKPK